jgi:hypothetical protein
MKQTQTTARTTTNLSSATQVGFTAKRYDIEHQHGLQIYVDAGMTPGPWLGIGVNNSLYVLGWAPEDYAPRPVNTRH